MTRDRENRQHTLRAHVMTLVPAVVLVGAVLGITLGGPGAFSAVANGLEHRGERGLVVSPSVVSTIAPGSTPTTGTSPSPPSPATAPTSSSPVSATTAPRAETTPPAASRPTTPADVAGESDVAAPLEEVTTIHVVPAERDVLVSVGGALFASAADGTILLPPSARHGDVQFVGFRETPSLRRATFTGWSDGDGREVRSLDSLSGPTVQLGIVLAHRVTATLATGTGEIVLGSEAGPVRLSAGVPQWVGAARAVAGADGLVAQPLTYTAESVDRNGTSTAVAPTQFAADAEAVWAVG